MALTKEDLKEQHLHQMTTGLQNLMAEERLTDLTLICDHVRFAASKAVLAASSQFFFDQLISNGHRSEMQLPPGLSKKAVAELLMFCCSGIITVSEDDINLLKELGHAAKALRFSNVQRYCQQLLFGDMSEKDFLKEWENDDTKEEVAKFIADNFPQLATNPDFSKLPYDCIAMVLGFKPTESHDPDIVFQGLLDWVKGDVDSRLKLMKKLLEFVQVIELSDTYLYQLEENEPLWQESIVLVNSVYKELMSRISTKISPAISVDSITRELSHRPSPPPVIMSEAPPPRETLRSQPSSYSKPSSSPGPRVVEDLFGNYTKNVGPSSDKGQFRSPQSLRRFSNQSQSRPRLSEGIQPQSPIIPESEGPLPMAAALMIKIDEDESQWEIYNINNKSLTGMTDMKTAVPYLAAICQDKERIYFAGGRDDVWKIQKTFFAFDLKTEEWHQYPDMDAPRWAAGAATTNGNVYVAGGIGSANQRLNCVDWLDLKSEKWDKLEPMNYCRERAAVCGLGNKLYVVGGYAMYHDQYKKREMLVEDHASYEVYDHKTMQWTLIEKSDLPMGREICQKTYLITAMEKKMYAIKILQDEDLAVYQFDDEEDEPKWEKIRIGGVSVPKGRSEWWLSFAGMGNGLFYLCDMNGNIFSYKLRGQMRKISEPYKNKRNNLNYGLVFSVV